MFKVYLKKDGFRKIFEFATLQQAKRFSIENYDFFCGLWFDFECVYTLLKRLPEVEGDVFSTYEFMKLEVVEI